MSVETRPAIAFLSLERDPATCENLLSVATALAQRGWTVDLFARRGGDGEPATTRIAPHCRIVRLSVGGDDASAFAKAIESFQIKSGLLSPLFHSFDDLSARVGYYFKQKKGWRWVHSGRTPEPLLPSADQVILLRSPATPPETVPTDEVNQMRHQRHWDAIASRLGGFYRQHLAIYVGAIGLEIPRTCHLPPLSGAREMAGDRIAG